MSNEHPEAFILYVERFANLISSATGQKFDKSQLNNIKDITQINGISEKDTSYQQKKHLEKIVKIDVTSQVPDCHIQTPCSKTGEPVKNIINKLTNTTEKPINFSNRKELERLMNNFHLPGAD